LLRAPAAPDPLPGWLDRRRQDLRPAEEVIAALPKGPALHAPKHASPEPDGRRRA